MSGFVDESMKQHVMKTNVMKDDFGWEVPVESVPLPSNGLVYNPNSLLHNKKTLQIKAMTAQEEDIIMSQAYAKDGTTILHLIKSCLIDKNIDVKELILGDRNALMISIRITGYGSKYDILPKCTNCDTVNNLSIDLAELPIKRLKIAPVEDGKNEFLFKLPVTGKSVIFKYMNAYDEQNRQAKIDFMRKTGMQSNTIVSFLEEVILSIDGITDKNKISQFVKNMPALDSKKLRVYITENQPGIDMDHQFHCTHCNHLNKISIPITSNFFWP
jgi:hypothetical protein